MTKRKADDEWRNINPAKRLGWSRETDRILSAAQCHAAAMDCSAESMSCDNWVCVLYRPLSATHKIQRIHLFDTQDPTVACGVPVADSFFSVPDTCTCGKLSVSWEWQEPLPTLGLSNTNGFRLLLCPDVPKQLVKCLSGILPVPLLSICCDYVGQLESAFDACEWTCDDARAFGYCIDDVMNSYG